MSTATALARPRSAKSFIDWLAHHWFEAFLVVYGLWVFLPFLAPLFMYIGWSSAGKAIYLIYSFFCHQMPQRSIFFFGEKTMYSLSEVRAAWRESRSAGFGTAGAAMCFSSCPETIFFTKTLYWLEPTFKVF